MWESCQCLSIPVPTIYAETGEITTGYLWGPTRPIVNFSQNSINLLASKAHPLTRGPQCFLLSPRISIHSDPVSKRPKVPLGKDWRKVNSTTFRHFIKVFPRRNWAIPSFKGFWVCKLPQVWDLVNAPRFPFVVIQISLSFVWEFLCLYSSNKNALDFFCLFF